MKIFMMLTVLLSMFFVISCGAEDDTGMSESDFYNKEETQVCERGFECNIDYITSAYSSASECSTQATPASCSTTGFTTFDGTEAQECIDCASALACDKFFDGITGTLTHCPACNDVCVPK